MPFATSRGQQIHYSVQGSGPLVVLQHGFLSDARSWKATGFLTALVDRYRVARIDSLGHGLSDKPADPAFYGQEQRAGDIVAVLDDLGASRAHLVGYSMGGWIAVGVAKHHPSRLASLTIGGWDLTRGVATGRASEVGTLEFEEIIRQGRQIAPALLAWVTPDNEPGLKACWESLSQLSGAEEAVLAADYPVLLWSGRDDSCHEPMHAFATARGLTFLSTPGDHNGAVLNHGPESARGIGAFLDRAERPGGGSSH